MENELKLEVLKSSGGYYYICTEERIGFRFVYLLPNGVLTTESRKAGTNNWSSQEEAQQFLDGWMPQSSWLTTDWIVLKAKQGDKEALDCSIEHWKQIVLAGYEKFKDSWNKVTMDGKCCALCQRKYFLQIDCFNCPLKACTLDNIWGEAEAATKENFTEKTINMLNHLVEIRNELYGNPYLVEEKKMATEMTVREIGEKLGYDVKVVKEEAKGKEPEVVWKNGDTAQSGGESGMGAKRIFIGKPNDLRIFGLGGYEYEWGLKSIEVHTKEYGYVKTGNIFKN